ncbi:MAG: DUF1540 domain-containing protein [Bacillota bacterium]|uniref:DUF1540 domain-containing protein n=1 Tax=Desulforudis sp. DRI-14 TaxID=3459793 RepID=UPI0034909F66
MSKVMKCMCEECHYNHNFECHADGIEVRSSGDKKVETSDGTCCNTFRPKQRGGRGGCCG